MRSELSTSQSGIDHRDDFITTVTPALVADQLGGHSVVLILLPDADTAMVKPLTRGLGMAGARVTGRIEVKEAWTDPAKLALRDQLATRLQSSLTAASPAAASGTASDAASTTSQRLAALFGRALVTTEISQSQRRDAVAQTVLKGLENAGLLSVDGDVTSPATEAVVIAPAVERATAKGASSSSSSAASPSPGTSGTWRELAQRLDGGMRRRGGGRTGLVGDLRRGRG